MAHSSQYHQFGRVEGNVLLKKLPEEAKTTLRYYEVACVLNRFRPLPPLYSGRKIIAGKKFYYIAVTDWSLMVLTKDHKTEGSVLLEIPWYYITDLVSALRCTPAVGR